MEECTIIQTREGYLVNSCTGEIEDFVAFDSVDYSSLEYYERASSSARKREENEIRDIKKIVLDYLLSVMTEKEKEEFYRILNDIERHRKAEAALYLAIYEHVLSKENKQVKREYLKFLKSRGIGRYAIRQRKKLLRQMLKEDPLVIYIHNEYQGNKEEALRIYELLKKHGIINGTAKKRKKILIHYLNNKELIQQLLEEEKRRELENTILLLNIRDFESVSFI